MKWVLSQVFKEAGDRDKQYASPLLASTLANLPQTKIITAGHDPLRFEAEEYLILAYFILSYFILSYFILSFYHILFYLIIVSYLTLSFLS
jgi:alpha/beta hydrolase fold